MTSSVSGSTLTVGVGNQNGNRGTGVFYDVTGDRTVGALMAWAWGVSRVIDALEAAPDQVDTTKWVDWTAPTPN